MSCKEKGQLKSSHLKQVVTHDQKFLLFIELERSRNYNLHFNIEMMWFFTIFIALPIKETTWYLSGLLSAVSVTDFPVSWTFDLSKKFDNFQGWHLISLLSFRQDLVYELFRLHSSTDDNLQSKTETRVDSARNVWRQIKIETITTFC